MAAKALPFSTFMVADGVNKLEIDTKPWGGGDLIISKKKTGARRERKDQAGPFQDRDKVAEWPAKCFGRTSYKVALKSRWSKGALIQI